MKITHETRRESFEQLDPRVEKRLSWQSLSVAMARRWKSCAEWDLRTRTE